jgi:Ulp1 family protease
MIPCDDQQEDPEECLPLQQPGASIVAEVNEFFNDFVLHKHEHTPWVHSNAELLKKVSYHECPSQQNSIDCGLFCVGVVLHLMDGINVNSTTFSQP